VGDSKPRQNYKNNQTSQEKRIKELKKLLFYYREITETVRAPFIILDNNLCVITANKAFYTKFKVLKKHTEDKLIYELGNNQWDIPELRELLEHILPKKRVLKNYEVSHDFPVLGYRTMNLNARQVDAKQLILLAIDDITVQCKLKADSIEMTANLTEQRDRLQALSDAKEEFISMASHQLRTPATAVKLYVGMLAGDFAGKMTEQQKRLLNVAYESNQRQLEIIEDLLRVARVDAGKVYLERSPCDVIQEVESVIKNQAALFKDRGQRVKLNTPDHKIIAFIDKKLMRMVLENILDNAGKYSDADQRVTIDVYEDDEFTTISIKDNGVGILKKDQQKLFKKFSRIDNRNSISVVGTGLGLYWAKKILDLHEGSIEVDSKLNRGTTFIVKIPVVADTAFKRNV
jgi:two-component system, cell cycle sensor histidine kinase PleC